MYTSPFQTMKIGENRYMKIGNDKTLFFSYGTLVIVVKDNIAYITSEYYSVTTTRHINLILQSIDSNFTRVKISQDILESL